MLSPLIHSNPCSRRNRIRNNSSPVRGESEYDSSVSKGSSELRAIELARYLTRIAHDGKLRPHDAKAIAQRIRLMLGSKEAIGNLRISNHVIELDLFARDSGQLSSFTDSLEKEIGKVVTLKLLDQPLTETREKEEILREGIELFNEETRCLTTGIQNRLKSSSNRIVSLLKARPTRVSSYSYQKTRVF